MKTAKHKNKPMENTSAIRKNVRGMRLGILVSKLDTFADIKTGRFRKLFNRHSRAYGAL